MQIRTKMDNINVTIKKLNFIIKEKEKWKRGL
jgi:hypothetical protein